MGDSAFLRLKYGAHLLRRWLSGPDLGCPHCKASDTVWIDTKQLLMQLRCCQECGLFFRVPKDDAAWNRRFYSEDYHEAGLVTTLPTDRELEGLLQSSFEDTRHDFSRYIRWVQECQSSGRLLDFGASWGYGTWQLAQAGYDVTGYEVDRRRAQFGRESLGLHMVHSPEGLDKIAPGEFDIVFSSHTLEHLPAPNWAFDQWKRLVSSGGWLVIIVPNCTGITDRDVLVEKRSWAYGRKHPLSYGASFFEENLSTYGFEIVTITTALDQYRSDACHIDLHAPELLVVARRSHESWRSDS